MRSFVACIICCLLMPVHSNAQASPEFDTLFHYKNNPSGLFEKVDPLLTANELQISSYGWQNVAPCLSGFSGYALASAQTSFNPVTNPYVELQIQAVQSDYAFQLNKISLQLRGENVGANFVKLSYSSDGGISWTFRPLPDSPNLSSACGQTSSINWTPSSYVEINGTTGLLFRIYYYNSEGFTGGNNQLLNLVLHGSISSHSEFYSVSSGNVSDAIWNPSPFGTIGYKVNFTPEITAHIQANHTVTSDLRNIFLKNLFVNNSGSLLPGSLPGISEWNLHIYDLLSNSGIIGDSTSNTFISIIPGGPALVVQGSGAFYLGRFGKLYNNNQTISLYLNNSDFLLRYPGNCIYNNVALSTLNINTTSSSSIRITGYNGILSYLKFGNAEGSDINNNIQLTIQGDLVINGTIFAFNTANSSTLPNLLNIKAGGYLSTGGLQLINNSSNGTIFETGSSVQINNSLKILEGNLVTNNAVSVSAGGSILHGSGISELSPFTGGQISGNVKFNATGTTFTNAYNYWSSPVNNSQLGVLSSAVSNNGGTFQGYFYNPLATTSNTVAGLRAGWISQAPEDIMVNGEGYICQGAHNVVFQGIPNNGIITKPLIEGPHTKFNLVGNPYPGPLNTTSFLTNNISNIVPAIYLWDDDYSGGADFSANDYIITNAAGTVATGGNFSNANLFTGNIAACQSFFVEKKDSGNQVEFNNSMRNSLNSTFFETLTNVQSRYWFRIESENNKKNEILIVFADSATDGYDEMFDAKKIACNEFLQLASITDDTKFAINTFSANEFGKTIPLSVYAGQQGLYKFLLANREINNSDALIYLYDNATGNETLLNQDTAYLAITDTSEISNRFMLIFEKPVKISTNQDLCHSNSGKIIITGMNPEWQINLLNWQGGAGEFIQPTNTDTISIAATHGIYNVQLNHSSGYEISKFVQIEQIILPNISLELNSENFLIGELIEAELLIEENEVLYSSWFVDSVLIQSGESNNFSWSCQQEGIHKLLVSVSDLICNTNVTRLFTVTSESEISSDSDLLSEASTFDVIYHAHQLTIQNKYFNTTSYLVEVYNTDGKLIAQEINSNAKEFKFYLNDLSYGIYVVRISDLKGKQLYTKKLLLF